jgi:signal transduction histidine kinase
VTIASNLSLRITAILLGAFVVLQLVIVVVTTLPSRGDDRRPYNLPLPGEAAAIVTAIDQAPPGGRGALVDAFNGGLYSVRIEPGLPVAGHTGPDLAALAHYYADAVPGRPVIVDGQRPALGRLIGSQPRPARFFAPVTVAIGLRGGGALVLVSQPSASIRGFLRSRSLLGALGGLIVLCVLMLAVRQTTRPLVDLSRGVRRFGASLDAPDLPVTGPREIRELAGAFNDMKTRIRELMLDRTRMLAAIAHDMRTYLTRLRLRVEFIDDPDHRARAARDLDEMAALLSDTLFFAEGDARPDPATTRIDLAAAAMAAGTLRNELGDAVTIHAGDEPLWVRATPMGVRRILDNLIDNGLRHGSAVTVRVERVGETIDLIVEDDGPGVPDAMLARLGEPFIRGDASRNRETGGAGLGLAIVRALVARDGADVMFANRSEGGLRVRVRYRAG